MKKSAAKNAYLAFAFVVTVAAVTLNGLFWTVRSPSPAASYQTSSVVLRDIEQGVLAFGKVHSSELVSVGSQVSGQIVKIHTQLNQKIKKGMPIAEIDSTTQRNLLKSAIASLRQAQSQLDAHEAAFQQAVRAVRRQQELFANDIGSKQELEAAELTRDTAKLSVIAQRSTVEISQLAVESARANIGYTRIVAPIDGQVVAVLAAEGQTVNANQITPNLALLANVDVMEVRVRISEADIGKVRQGQNAKFTLLGGGGREYESVIKSVDPAPESIINDFKVAPSSVSAGSPSGPVYYSALMEVGNDDGSLKLSMTANVKITIAASKNVLSIPTSTSLLTEGAGRSAIVNVLTNGRPVAKKIRLGISDNQYIEVIEGLQLGDEVIIGPSST